jgi:hypothetical protein
MQGQSHDDRSYFLLLSDIKGITRQPRHCRPASAIQRMFPFIRPYSDSQASMERLRVGGAVCLAGDSRPWCLSFAEMEWSLWSLQVVNTYLDLVCL